MRIWRSLCWKGTWRGYKCGRYRKQDRIGESKGLLVWSFCFLVSPLISIYTYLIPRTIKWRHLARPTMALQRRILCVSITVFLFEHVARAITSIFLRNSRWHHGRSQGETKYRLSLVNNRYQRSLICFFVFVFNGGRWRGCNVFVSNNLLKINMIVLLLIYLSY